MSSHLNYAGSHLNSPGSNSFRASSYIRGLKLHVYGKPKTSDSSSEFLKIENEHIKTAQNNSYGLKKLRETTNLRVEITNSKRKINEKFGHVVQIRVCRMT